MVGWQGNSWGLGGGVKRGGVGTGWVWLTDARGFRSNNLGFNSIWLCPSVGSMEWIRGSGLCVCVCRYVSVVCVCWVRERDKVL